MTSQGARYTLDGRRFAKLMAPVVVAWLSAMCGLVLVASSPDARMVALAVGIVGAFVAVAIVAIRTVRPRYPMLRPFESAPAAPHARRWTDLADPRGNFANRWAMYNDLATTLAAQDWSAKTVGEFGAANDVLRALMPGAKYRLFTYPEHDLQDLRQVRDASLDVAVLDQTLEHIEDPERALREVRRVLREGGLAIITTPFLVPVHATDTYGDYYRWTPQGMSVMLRRCGFTGEVRMWGNRAAAASLLTDVHMTAARATACGLEIELHRSEPAFPVTVWVVAQKAT